MKSSNSTISISLDDDLSDGGSMCSNSGGNLSVASFTQVGESEDVGGKDGDVARVQKVESGDVCDVVPPIPPFAIDTISPLRNTNDVTKCAKKVGTDDTDKDPSVINDVIMKVTKLVREVCNNYTGNDPSLNDDVVTSGNEKIEVIVVPQEDDNTYFKGLLTFALWGYIPPSGGEKYKSSMIHSVVQKETKITKTDSRRGSSVLLSDEKKEVLSLLEKSGVRKNSISDITTIMSNGRLERKKQKLYEVKIDSVEYDIRFHTNRILELQSEVKELKEELRDDPDDTENQIMLIKTKN